MTPSDRDPGAAEHCPPISQLPQGSPRKVLDALRAELEAEPETEATLTFAKCIEALTEEYKGIVKVVDSYRKAHEGFVGKSKDNAKRQWDDIKSWTDDKDEVDPKLKKPIEELRQSYQEEADAKQNGQHKAQAALEKLKNCLEFASSQAGQSQADFDELKKFEEKAKKWFDELTTLHGTAKGHLDASNPKALYAVRLEFQVTWQKTLELESSKDPEWLQRKLTELLTVLIEAKFERFSRHKQWLDAENNADRAAAEFESFESTRQENFIREAQDVTPESSC